MSRNQRVKPMNTDQSGYPPKGKMYKNYSRGVSSGVQTAIVERMHRLVSSLLRQVCDLLFGRRMPEGAEVNGSVDVPSAYPVDAPATESTVAVI